MERKHWLFVVGLVLLALGAGAWWFTSRTSVTEVAEAVAQGGELKLRETMRPAAEGTKPRLLVFAFDGIGDREFRAAIREGAPRLQALLGAEQPDNSYAHAYAAADALSILPSTTMAAWSSVYTGEPPARTGVSGNEWFVREERQFYAPAPVSITETDHTLKMLNDGLVGNALRVPTLYELLDLRAYVSLAPVYRGADLFTSPGPEIVAELFGGLVEGVTGDGMYVRREVYSEIDEESVERVVETIERYGPADVQVVYFPGVDLYSHVNEEPLEKQKSYLREVLDRAVGHVLDAYDTHGALGQTYVIFIADHGHTPVLDDDRHSLAAEGEDEPPAVLEKIGFRLRPLVITPDEEQQDYQAAFAYQGAMAYIYLADRSACVQKGERCDWSRPPRLEEDVLAAARAFYEASRSGALVPQLKDTLDLVFAREPRPPGQDALPFQVFDGRRLVPIKEFLRRHPRPDLIDLERRMDNLSAGPYGHRAGDVLLLARSGLERPVEERFYFAGFYRSWHGSPTAQDSHIPFVLARRGDSGARLGELVRRATGGEYPTQLHLVPLARALMESGQK